MKEALIPLGHPNRHGWKLDYIGAYIVHSTANLKPWAGDEFHGDYFRRKYESGDYVVVENGVRKKAHGFIEAKSMGTGELWDSIRLGVKFRTGATHVGADADSRTLYVPLDEYVPGAGDRPLPWEPLNCGEKPLARLGFAFRQNWRALQIEICENGGWNVAAENNARDWIIDDARARGLKVDLSSSLFPTTIKGPASPGYVFVLRHFDLTGKRCPTRMWGDDAYWSAFVRSVASAVNG